MVVKPPGGCSRTFVTVEVTTFKKHLPRSKPRLLYLYLVAPRCECEALPRSKRARSLRKHFPAQIKVELLNITRAIISCSSETIYLTMKFVLCGYVTDPWSVLKEQSLLWVPALVQRLCRYIINMTLLKLTGLPRPITVSFFTSPLSTATLEQLCWRAPWCLSLYRSCRNFHLVIHWPFCWSRNKPCEAWHCWMKSK